MASREPLLKRMGCDPLQARLERMLYVGLTEKHKDSAKLFAAIIHRPLSSAAHAIQGEAGCRNTLHGVLSLLHRFADPLVCWLGSESDPEQ